MDFQVPGHRRRRKKSKRDGKAWTDMYEAASQAGGDRVRGQARQRRQTPVLEDERGEMRCAPEDCMDRGRARGARWICYRQKVRRRARQRRVCKGRDTRDGVE